MHIVTFDSGPIAVLQGLTQWDYGQKISIRGLNIIADTEVHFSLKGSSMAVIRIGKWVGDGLEVGIPDDMLQDGRDINAYIYLADEKSGRTIRTIKMCVNRRARPEKIEVKENVNALEYLMKSKADNLQLVDGALQLLAGNKPVGDRIRLPNSGGQGREIELKNDGIAICQRYTDSNEWNTLALLEDLRGPAGATPEFEIRAGHLYAIYKEE